MNALSNQITDFQEKFLVASLAQLVEHFISNEEVVGSNPAGSSFPFFVVQGLKSAAQGESNTYGSRRPQI
jgi:hypothetical protein